jgi:hypothetical protein
MEGNRTKFVFKLEGEKAKFSVMFTELLGREEGRSSTENGDVVKGMH